MKKIIISCLLLFIMIVPTFALNVELVPKVGYAFSPKTTIEYTQGDEKENVSFSDKSAISATIETFFDTTDYLFMGFGLSWNEETQIKETEDTKASFIDFYGTAKYKFLINSNQDNPFFVYPFAQLGFALPIYSYNPPSADISNYDLLVGLYLGAGVGIEYKNIILECLYCCNYSSQKYIENSKYHNDNLKYSMLKVNVGYRLSL